MYPPSTESPITLDTIVVGSGTTCGRGGISCGTTTGGGEAGGKKGGGGAGGITGGGAGIVGGTKTGGGGEMVTRSETTGKGGKNALAVAVVSVNAAVPSATVGTHLRMRVESVMSSPPGQPRVR